MKLIAKILIPVLIFVGSVFAARTIVSNKPEPRTRPSFSALPAVDATRLKRSDYQVVIRSQGTVKPGRESSVVPEVTGIIRSLSPRFVVGDTFESGEVLVEIDGRDYEIAVAQANARYAQASASLQEEKARSSQAQADWKSLGKKGKPSALSSRTPQLAAARANLAAANAEIQKAQLDLERTKIVAPYAGRVLEKRIDEGEFVSRGAALGRIYSLQSAEVRLPLSSRQLAFLELPSSGDVVTDSPTNVLFSASVGGAEAQWAGTLTRSEGVDAASQQLYVVANIPQPFVSSTTVPALQTGQFVNAEILGRVLKDVFVVPRSALRENNEVLLVDGENSLRKAEVTVGWSDDKVAAITSGLSDGDILTLTTLGVVTNGTTVRATIDGVAPPRGQGGVGGGKVNSDSLAGKSGSNQASAQKNTSQENSNQINSNQGNSGEDRQQRMAKLKAMVDQGQPIPEDTKARLRERLASGAPLPPWLKKAIEE